eukprot:SAG31_NODE_9410_length_1282_cov_1.440406_1_plen_120_part_00
MPLHLADDHVTPPFEDVPADDSECVVESGCSGHDFDFKRLGIRVTSLLISPWIPANTVIRTPTGPTPTSQFDLTVCYFCSAQLRPCSSLHIISIRFALQCYGCVAQSGIATAKNLFNLS